MEKESQQKAEGKDPPLRQFVPSWLSRNALLFSLTSFLNDISSEMIFPILPIFVTVVLGAPAWAVGVMEGVAHATETLLRGISGYYSDLMPRRRPLVVAGYGLSSVTKPVFALTNSWPLALLVRSSDRVGKGLRVTPRDAMLAEDSRGPSMGKIFGVRKMADSAGAVLGPLITFVLLALLGYYAVPLPDAYRIVFLLSFFPAALGVLLVFGVKEKEKNHSREPLSKTVRETLMPPPGPWRNFLALSALFALGNISYAFFILSASDSGVGAAEVALLYVVYNIFYMIFSVPAGYLTDKYGSKRMLFATFAFFAAVCAVFGLEKSIFSNGITHPDLLGISGHLVPFAFGFALYGIFSAGYETIARIYVAQHFPDKKLGSGLGAYNIVLGVMALPSGIISGLLYPVPGPFGASMAFWFGGTCAALSAVGILAFYRHSYHIDEIENGNS